MPKHPSEIWTPGKQVSKKDTVELIDDLNSVFFDEITDVGGKEIPASIKYIIVAGNHFKRLDEEPEGLSVQSLDGTWWGLHHHFHGVMASGAVGNGLADDTAAFQNAVSVSGEAQVPYGREFLIDPLKFDIRKASGSGNLKLTTGMHIAAESIMDRGPIAQRYIMEFKNTNSKNVTQALAMYSGKLYRSQQGSIANGSSFDYESTVLVSEYDFPDAPHSRADIDYASDSGAITENYQVEIKGLGHGDGIAFLKEGETVWLYGVRPANPTYKTEIGPVTLA
ncbi:hypothetical protein PsAD5_02906 [Pseudovibrio sp. Ad5]|uniref:hypothetical protein n=1 Tax=Pseudovibrio sp. Ad5 TaxID=989436 RepID=UPI0007AE5A8E|nr:hypothetical protein [Pseudovibrio sp. Ad5]KZK95142.1 hypothetical protein PsAD5_02906 [Pseudovibrio sp. Ad5]